MTSFRTIAASILDCLFYIFDSSPVVKHEMFKDVVDTFQHTVSLFQAWAVAVFIGIFRRHVQLSILSEPVSFITAAIYLLTSLYQTVKTISLTRNLDHECCYLHTYLSWRHSRALVKTWSGLLVPTTPGWG